MIKRAILLATMMTLGLQANAQSVINLNSALSINSKQNIINSAPSLPYAGKDLAINHINNLNINHKVIC